MSCNIAVLGASKFGLFHIQEFLQAGAQVSAILGSTEETAKQTQKLIKNRFGIHVHTYTDIEELLEKEKLQGVSICTPPYLHAPLAHQVLNRKLPLFCEKPFIYQNTYTENLSKAQELVALAKKNQTTLIINTQWPYLFNSLPELHKPIHQFSMYMEPAAESYIDCIYDAMPHMNSLLLHLTPMESIENISLSYSKQVWSLIFDYNTTIKVSYGFGYKESRPRRVQLTLNNESYEREIGPGYTLSLKSKNKSFPYKDPMALAITHFVTTIKNHSFYLNERAILDNVNMQDILMAHVLKEKALHTAPSIS